MQRLFSLTLAGMMLVAASTSAEAGKCRQSRSWTRSAPTYHYYTYQGRRYYTAQQPQRHVAAYRPAAAPPPPAASQEDAPQAKDIVDTAAGAGSFKTLVAAVKAAGLVETLKGKGPFTVFAPTDDAFGKLPEGTVENLLKPENKDQLVSILTYHVVPGRVLASDVVKLSSAKTVQGQEVSIKVSDGTVMVDNAQVVKTDIECANGVIHVIDNVILPKAETAKAEHEGMPLEAEGVGSFKTLFAAIEAAGLKETLATKGPFTVFAPTDAAFAKLPEGTLEELLKPESKDKLVSILTYHVVPGKVMAAQVVDLTSAKTVNGKEVSISVDDSGVKVDNANVIKTDLECEVGVIHAIDAVILP